MAVIITTSDTVDEVVQSSLKAEAEPETKEEPKAKEKPAPKEVRKPEAKEEQPDVGDEIDDDDEPEEAEPADEAAEPEEKPEPKKGKLPPWVAERIRKANAARDRAREDADRERDRASSLERKLAEKPEAAAAATDNKPKTWSGKPRPTRAEFQEKDDPDEAFGEALADWRFDERVAEQEAKAGEREAEKQEKALDEQFKQNAKKAATRITDYAEVIAAGEDIQLSLLMSRRIRKSPVGPDILHYFAGNEDAAAEVAAMDADDQVAAMVRLENKFKKALKGATPADDDAEEPEEKPKLKPKASAAPAPATRLKPAGTGPKSVREMAGPDDRQGVAIQASSEYQKQRKANSRFYR